MAMNAELFLSVTSLKIENDKINAHIKDIDGRIKERLHKEAVSKDLSNVLHCSADYRRVSPTLLGSLILNVFQTTVIIILVALLSLERSTQERRAPLCSTIPVEYCPDGWVGYQRKCYYFAEAERNWTSSKMSCSSFSASLAVVDSQDEMDFLKRYKTSADHWIGLQRDLETEPWKWINGTIFNN